MYNNTTSPVGGDRSLQRKAELHMRWFWNKSFVEQVLLAFVGAVVIICLVRSAGVEIASLFADVTDEVATIGQ